MQKAAAAAEAVIRPLLKGKSAVVTGSTSGIGLGIARAFVSAGMTPSVR
jgi:3-hydroxybutyrate dehydrogenase